MRATATVAVLVLLGCSGDPKPAPERATPETEPVATDGATDAATDVASDIAWAGVYTDAERTLTITDSRDGRQIAYEDNTVPGWSSAWTATAEEQDGRLECTFRDQHQTKLRVAFAVGTVTITAVREGHGPRTHPLARVKDTGARAAAEAEYRAEFPNKTVGFPKRRAELLENAAEKAAAEKRAEDAVRLFAAAAQLFEPLAERMWAAVHRQAALSQPDANTKSTWSAAAGLYARAAALAAPAELGMQRAASLMMQAFCVDPSNDTEGGSFPRAAELYTQATAAFDEPELGTRCRKAHGVLLHRWATSEQPNTNAKSKLGWAGVTKLYALAAELRAKGGDTAGEAQSLNNLAVCLAPSRNPEGDWERSAAMHAEVAALHKTVRNRAGWQGSVRAQAKCLWHQAKDLLGTGGDNADAHALFERAHQLAVAAKAPELAQTIQTWLETLRGN